MCGAKKSLSVSTISIAQDTSNTTLDSDRIIKLLDSGLIALFGAESPQDALQKIIRPNQVVGLKVNCLSGRGSTNIDLVSALSERLRQIGVPAEQIIIWDRFSSDLEDGGYRINTNENGIRCFGNDFVGFEQSLEQFGEAASLICKTMSRLCDVVINLPVLKDHGIAGITGAMKNLFGAIHNPHKYHLNTGNPYIADVFKLPSISKKVRLQICDALVAQYEGGPSFMPQWRWEYKGILMGTDPVALDQTGWQIIEKKRQEKGLLSLADVGREPRYIATAADYKHGLGTNKSERIRLVTV
jgi:uncharacterized protein (DUF362 family)